MNAPCVLARLGSQTARTSRESGVSHLPGRSMPLPGAVGAHLVPAPTDGHVAPLAGAVARAVVERPAAVRVDARLQPRPAAVEHRRAGGGEDGGQGAVDARSGRAL